MAELAVYPEIVSFAQVRRSPHSEDWLRILAEARPPYTRGTRCSLRVPRGKLRSARVIPRSILIPRISRVVRTIRAMRGDRPATVDPETGRSIERLFVRPLVFLISNVALARIDAFPDDDWPRCTEGCRHVA